MIYGTAGKFGYLEFDTSKKVKLSENERQEFELWVKSRILADREKQG